MDTITNLRTFLSVVHHASFSRAARTLHVVPSVVAKRIAQLEKTMGARLFDRSTRAVTLTEAGHRLQIRAQSVVEDFEDLRHGIKRNESTLEGHIRLMIPTTLSMACLGTALVEFLVRHDRVTIEIVLADAPIDPADIFDIVISGRSAIFDGVQQIPLMSMDGVLCASPTYLKQGATLTHPSELSRHACLILRSAGSIWSFRSADGPVHVQVLPRMTADDNYTLRAAAVAGLGIALLPKYIAGAPVEQGQLVSLLGDFQPQEAWYRAYVGRRSATLPRVKMLCSWLKESLKELPGAGDAPITAVGTAVRGTRK